MMSRANIALQYQGNRHPCRAALFVAARAQLVEKVIEPALHAEKLVIATDLSTQSVAYRGSDGELISSDVHM